MSASAEERAANLLPLRIIGFALVMGPAMFLGVAYFLRSRGGFDAGGADSQVHDILHWALLAVAMGAVTLHVMLPKVVRTQQGGTIESFRVVMIVRLAITEGAALFGVVCFLLSGRPLGAGVTLAMLGFALLLQFPTRERLDTWLDRTD
jgi:hypothetical protein